jgi:hypothetical protein
MATAGPEVEAKPVRRRRTTKADAAEVPVSAGEAVAEATPAVKTTRSRTAKAVTTTAKPRARKAAAGDGAAAPKKPATRRRTTSAAKEEG